jgi:hypothetical protein
MIGVYHEGMRLAVVPLAVSALAACGESLSGLSSDPPPDAGAEAASVADATAPSDADLGDSGADARTEAGAARFCTTLSPAPVFCDDFDDTTPLEQNWALGLINGSATKTGGNLLITNPALATSTDESTAYVARSMMRPATIEVSFAFFADAQTTFRRSMVQLTTSNGSAFYHVEVNLAGPNELRLDEYAEPGFDGASYFAVVRPLTVSAALGAWKKVRIEVTHEGSPRARLWFEGAQSPTMDVALTPTVVSPTVRIAVGTGIVRGPMAASGMRLDDVVIRTK